MADSYKGTGTFNMLMNLAGWRVGRGSVLMGGMPQELTLLAGGEASVTEPGATISTHYVQSGRLFYVPVKWVPVFYSCDGGCGGGAAAAAGSEQRCTPAREGLLALPRHPRLADSPLPHATPAGCRVGRNAWVQARTRVLAAPVLGDQSRVLPASMVLPNEEVGARTIWGGVPANPVGRVEELDLERAIQRAAALHQVTQRALLARRSSVQAEITHGAERRRAQSQKLGRPATGHRSTILNVAASAQLHVESSAFLRANTSLRRANTSLRHANTSFGRARTSFGLANTSQRSNLGADPPTSRSLYLGD